MKKFVILLLISSSILLTACAAGETGAEKMDYDQTKKMIVDILKTDEGKKAIKDIMADQEMKDHLIMDQTTVTDTVEKTLTSDKGKDFWKKSFKDPKFAEAVAKSMKSENEKILKDLMKDPEYQGMMMDVMRDPELQKDVTQVLKSKEFREHLQEVVAETFESPLYKARIQDVLMKAAEDVKSGQGGKSQGKSQGGGQGGGESSP